MGIIITLVAYVAVYILIASLFGLGWDYSISFWLVYFDKPDTFYYWHGFLISLTPGIGQLAVIITIVTFIFSFFA